MAANLLRLEGEKIEVVPDTKAGKASVISDKDLDILLDRSPEVFVDRGKGWTAHAQTDEEGAADVEGEGEEREERSKAKERRAAFAVYEAPTDEGNDALAALLGEDMDALEVEDADEA